MKNLKTLFNCGIDVVISGVQLNSKQVKKGDLFICRKGINSDAHDFINEAIENGALALVCDRNVNVKVPVVMVNDVNFSIPEIMDWYYGNPNNKFKNVVGVTGTAGKTTVCNLINEILNYKLNCGCIGTNGVHSKKYNFKEFDVPNTTLPIDKLYKIIDKFKENKVDNIVIESSSYGLKQNRLGNITFDIALVTNFSEAHIGEHSDIKDYLSSKLEIVRKIKKNGYLVLNADDINHHYFKDKSTAKAFTFGKNDKADLYFKDIKEGLYETDFIIVYKGNEYNIKTKLIGINNVYNICASVLTCILLGLTIEDCISAINNFSMKGRMENYKGVIIDFAVTVDALRKDMQFLSKNKKGKIISVIGRLEERDIFEYKEFGKISTKYSDYVIFTTDRNKSGISLALEGMTGTLSCDNYEVIYDRGKAIEKALEMKQKDDVVYIVGCEYLYRRNKEVCVNPYDLIDRYVH